jgi:hypothetical protein
VERNFNLNYASIGIKEEVRHVRRFRLFFYLELSALRTSGTKVDSYRVGHNVEVIVYIFGVFRIQTWESVCEVATPQFGSLLERNYLLPYKSVMSRLMALSF